MLIEVTNHEGQKPKVNPDHVVVIMDKQVHFSNGLMLDLSEDSIKRLEDAHAPKNRHVEAKETDLELVSLFNKLHKLTKGKGSPTFSVKRQEQLKYLLNPKKGNMTEEALIRAATNIGNDEFLQGKNDGNGGKGKRYGDIDYLLRPDKAAKYADIEVSDQKKKMF